jgi:hypothetical protein
LIISLEVKNSIVLKAKVIIFIKPNIAKWRAHNKAK